MMFAEKTSQLSNFIIIRITEKNLSSCKISA